MRGIMSVSLLKAGRVLPLLLIGIVVLSGCAGTTRPTTDRKPVNPSQALTIADQEKATVNAASSCPVTLPNGSIPPGVRDSPLWHGNGSLWTQLWPEGKVIAPPANIDPDGSVWTKFAWMRGPEVRGELSIQGRRLDAPAPPLQASFTSYGDSGFQPSIIIFPTEGCWEVTGTANDASLTFVTLVIKV